MDKKTPAEWYADCLNEKFGDKYTFSVNKGRVYDKIVKEWNFNGDKSIHCFIGKTSGDVYMAAGWNAPAKEVRYTDMEQALKNADPFGSYLYKSYKKEI